MMKFWSLQKFNIPIDIDSALHVHAMAGYPFNQSRTIPTTHDTIHYMFLNE